MAISPGFLEIRGFQYSPIGIASPCMFFSWCVVFCDQCVKTKRNISVAGPGPGPRRVVWRDPWHRYQTFLPPHSRNFVSGRPDLCGNIDQLFLAWLWHSCIRPRITGRCNTRQYCIRGGVPSGCHLHTEGAPARVPIGRCVSFRTFEWG